MIGFRAFSSCCTCKYVKNIVAFIYTLIKKQKLGYDTQQSAQQAQS